MKRPAARAYDPLMTVEFGLALENFTPEAKVPDLDAISAYSITAEELGFASVWAWDHLFLGARRPFPFAEALTTLSMVAARTSRIMLGTGILVLPIREPAILAKTAATIQSGSHGRLMLGVAAGWYEREFLATAVPFGQRGRIFERNLDMMYRLWADDDVTGEWDGRVLQHVRMLPRPAPRPAVLIGGYVDRVLRRVAARSDGWVTYFYAPSSIAGAWSVIRGYAEEAGRDPDGLNLVAQVPLCIGDSYEEATRRAFEYVGDYFDVPAWSEATPESSVRGTPEQCAEQIAAYVRAGVKHLVFCPYNYRAEQVYRLATEVLPLLGTMSRVRAPITHRAG
jgi:probable F420-dependent oxidoreductase